MLFLIHSEQLFEMAFSRIFRRSNQLKIGTERLDTLVKQIKKSKNQLVSIWCLVQATRTAKLEDGHF